MSSIKLRLFEESINLIDGGKQIPGTLAEIRTPDNFHAAIYVNDQFLCAIQKNRLPINYPIWEAADEVFFSMCKLFSKEISNTTAFSLSSYGRRF